MMNPATVHEDVPDQQEGEVSAQKGLRVRMRTLLGVLFGVSLLGSLSAFLLPMQLILLFLAGLLLFMLAVKFVRDNVRLVRQVGMRRLLSAAAKSALCFLPFLLFLLPGYYVSRQVNDLTNWGIEKLEAWSAPEESIKDIERRVEERVRQELPWWYVPVVWTGFAEDYVTQVRTEVQRVRQQSLKPMYIRGTAGALKAALLCVGVYSTLWVTVLFARAYGTVLGRVLVASEPPIVFDLGGAGERRGASQVAGEEAGAVQGRLRSGANMVLAVRRGDEIFVRSSDLPTNAAPDLKPRWSNGSAFLRLRRGLFFMNRIGGSEPAEDVKFHASGAYSYISVLLEKGQEVVVDPDRLVGFSSKLTFRSHWDFNVAVMALGRSISLVVRGPGWLLLKCDGQSALYERPEEAPALSPDKLILFGSEARFHIRASEGFINYLASGCVVKPVAGRLFVAAPEGPKISSFFARFWSLVKQVYVPI